MPGSIKVNGSQRAVATPYIKVSGNWRQVAAGYIKVNGSWRVWHTAEIVDNFNRVNSSTLGTASNGVAVWSTLRGSWGIVSSVASSSTAAADYAIATTPITKATQNYQINIDTPTGAGTGVAFWVTNTNNWWGAVTWQETTSFYTCPNGGTLSGTSCITGSSSYPATANTTSTDLGAVVYTCPSGGTLSGTFCITGSTQYAATATTTTTSTNPTTATTYYKTQTLGPNCTSSANCPDGAPCINGKCTYDIGCDVGNNPESSTPTSCSTQTVYCTTGTYNPFTGKCDSTSTTYSCPNGGDLEGTQCIVTSGYEASASCPSGGSPSGGRCISSTTTYSCPNGGTLSGTSCVTTTSYPATLSSGVNYQTRIIQSVSGTVSVRASQTTTGEVKSLRVSTVGNQISVISYLSAGQTGTNTTLTHTPTSPAITNLLGIIKSPSSTNQASTVDNFRAS